jgi:hypothetical protein
MNKAILPIVALACLAIGGVVGFLLGQPGESPRVTIPEATYEDVSRAELPPPQLQADPIQPVTTPKPDVSFRAALHNVEIGEVPTGQGTITGRVATLDGQPVEGATIRARLGIPPSRFAAGEASVEDELEDYVRRRRWQEAGTRAAVSDKDGSYVLNGLDPLREYQLAAQHESYIVEPAQRGFARNSAGDVVNFVATPSIALDVVLLFEDGTPVPDGQIDRTGTGTDGRSRNYGGMAYLAPFHRLIVRPGKWTITGRHGPGGLYSGKVDVETIAGEGPRRLEIRLEGKAAIVGLLTLPELFIGQRASIRLQQDPPAGPPEAESNLTGARSARVDIRATQESFRFNELESGSILVTIGRGFGPFGDQGPNIAAWQDVEVSRGENTVRLTVSEPERAEYIVVRVYSPGGETLTDVAFKLSMRRENSGASTTTTTLKHPDGSYWIHRSAPDVRWGGSDLGENWWYVLEATSAEFGQREVRYERADTHVVEIRYVAPAHLTLNVPGWEGHDNRADMRWSVVAPDEAGELPLGRRMRGSDTGLDAPFRFGPLEPGEYDVVLMLSLDDRSNRRELVRRRVNLLAGENTLSLTVPALHSITVRVPDHVPVRYLHLWPRDTQPTAGRRSDNIVLELREGRATVAQLAPGTYRLVGDIGESSVSVPTSGEIVFDPPRYNAVLLYNIRPGGQIEALGLRNNDLLIAIDGEEVMEALSTISLYNKVQDKTQTTWAILRNGAQLEVTFDGTALQRIWRESDADKRERIWTSATYR